MCKLNSESNSHVGESTIAFFDNSRNRPITAEFWYPTEESDYGNQRVTELPFILESTIRDARCRKQKHPLVILSHGTGGNRFALAWLAIALAQKGYIVAAPDHWGNTFDNKIPECFVNYWDRPRDISFLLSHIMTEKTFSRYIDYEKIGSIGFSFGGYTVLALAGAEVDLAILKNKTRTEQGKKEFFIPELGDLRELIDNLTIDNTQALDLEDNRIKVFIALAPSLGLGFESSVQTKNINAPVLIVGAENDQITPVCTNARNYHTLIPSSQYVELPGKAGHYVFLNEAKDILKHEEMNCFVDDTSVSRKHIHQNIENVVIQYLKSNL